MVGGTTDFADSELMTLSWPLQVDTQTEDSDMNKRRRKGFNNLDEVRAHGVHLSKGWLPGSQWPQLWPFPFLFREPLGSKLGLMEKPSGSGPRPPPPPRYC